MSGEYFLPDLRKSDGVILTKKELMIVNSLIRSGRELLSKLGSPVAYSLFSKLVKSYAEKIMSHYDLLNSLVDRLLKPDAGLSIRVDSIVKLGNKLILARNRAKLVDERFNKLLKRLKSSLLVYGVDLGIDYELRFTLKDSSVYSGMIVLNIDEASVNNLIINFLNHKAGFIIEKFLVSEESLIKAGMVDSMLERINVDNLRLCVSSNKAGLRDAVIKVYVLLNNVKRILNALSVFLKSNLIAVNEAELDLREVLILQRFKEDRVLLHSHLGIVRSLIVKGLDLKDLISVKLIDGFLADPAGFIKAWLFTRVRVKDLIKQLAFEFLCVNADVSGLNEYADFKKRSPYLLFKRIFS